MLGPSWTIKDDHNPEYTRKLETMAPPTITSLYGREGDFLNPNYVDRELMRFLVIATLLIISDYDVTLVRK